MKQVNCFSADFEVWYMNQKPKQIKKKIKYQLDAKLNYISCSIRSCNYKSDLLKTFDKRKAFVVTLKVYIFSYFWVQVA